MVSVPVGGLLDGTNVDVQGAQDATQLQAELAQGARDLLPLGHPIPFPALLASLGSDLRWRHASGVQRLHGARLHRTALLADAPRPKLAPLLHKGSALRGTSSRETAVVLRDVVRSLRLRDVIVQEELLLDPVPVGLAALLVSRDLFAGQVCEGTLAAAQSGSPIFGNLLGLLRGPALRRWRGFLDLPRLVFRACA